MGLRILHKYRLVSIDKQLFRRFGLGLCAFVLAASSIATLPPQPAKADYDTFSQTASSTIGTRTTYNGAPGLAFDSAGNSYFSVAGSGEDFIRVISPSNTFVRDITPYEPNLAYGAFGPPITLSTITVDSSGNVYATVGGNRIQKLTSDGTYIRTIGGAGTGDGQFGTIGQMTTDSSDNLYVVDKTANRIQKFDSNGNFLLKFGSLGSGDNQFNQIADLEIDPSGNLFVADGNNKRVKKFTSDGVFLLKFGAVNTALGCPAFPSFNTLKSVTIDSSGTVYVGASTTGLCNIYVQRFDTNGTYLGNFSLLSNPSRVKMNRAQNQLYSQEIRTNSLLSRYTSTGTYIDDIGYRLAAGNFLGESTYIQDRIVQDSDGNTYVIDSDGNYRIQKFNSSGAYVSSFGAFGSGNGQFRRITSITLSPSGQLYVADAVRHDIQVFSTSGTFVTKFGSSGSGDGQFASNGPGRMKFATNGDLYVSNEATGFSVSSRIIVFDSSNIFKKNITSYQQNGQTVNLGSTIYNFALTSNDTLIILKSGSPKKLLRIDSNGVFIDEKSLLTLTGENVNHKFYHSTGRLYVDSNDTIYLTGTETDSPETSLLQRPILAAINFDVPGIPDFRHVKSLGSTQDAIYFSANNSLHQWSSRFNYLSTYSTTGTVHSPSAPQNLTANSPARGKVAASWAAPTGSGDGPVLGYRIDYKSHSSSGWTTHTTTTNTTDTIIHLPTDSYDVRVFAYNLAGVGTPAIFENIPVIGVSNPSAPLNLSVASPNLGTANLTWQYPSDDGGEAITTYKVEYKPHANGQWLLYSDTVSTTTAIITGLLDDTYDFRVSALNSSGTGTSATHDNLQLDNTYGFKEKLGVFDDGYIQGVQFDSSGKRYENDYYNDKIDVYSVSGAYEYSFGTSGTGINQMYSPRQGAISSDNRLYIPDSGNDRVQIYELDGTHVGSFGTSGTGDGEMSYPVQAYIDSADNIYVISEYENIQKYDKDGTYLGRIATDAVAPVSMTIDASGNIFVANASYDTDHGIIKYASNGTTRLDHIGSEGSAPGQMYEAYGMVINAANQLIIADTYNDRLQIFDANGDFIQAIGRGYGDDGEYLTLDEILSLTQASNGDVYIANGYSPHIQVLNYTGKTTAPESTIDTPSQPLGVIVDKDTANQLTIKWNAPSDDGGSAITNYKIEHKLSSQSGSVWTPYVISGSLREYTLPNLQATCHDIQISAGNSQGYGDPVLVECTEVHDPALPSTPSTPTTPPVTTPSTVKTPAPSSTPVNSTPRANAIPTVSPTDEAPAASLRDTITSNKNTPSVSVSTTNNDTATITWQTPSDMEPQRYIIEYRDASIPESDTTTPWKRISEVPGNHSSATISLPEGSYNVRVAAVLPGGKATRVILGVARVSIPRYTNTAALESGNSSTALPLWATVCIAIFTLALLFFIPIIWKKRRKKAQANSVQPPPQHWS
jgi:sugar lactone lactonase YvrE